VEEEEEGWSRVVIVWKEGEWWSRVTNIYSPKIFLIFDNYTH